MATDLDYGFIVGLIRKIFSLFSEIPGCLFLGKRANLKIPENKDERRKFAQKRAVKVDLYVCAWLVIELVCFSSSVIWPFQNCMRILVTVLCCVRIIEISLANLDIAIFRAQRNPVIASFVRTLVLMIINYNELWLCFTGIYAANPRLLQTANPWDAPYFSGATQLTIGYGDVLPVRWGRAIALAQGWIGVMFALLILSRLVALIPSLQEADADVSCTDERIVKRNNPDPAPTQQS